MEMSRFTKRLGIAVPLVLGISVVCATADMMDGSRDIFDKWAKREKMLNTLRFEWDNQVALKPGSQRASGKKQVPANELSFDSMESLTLKGDWMTFKTRGLGYNERDNDFVKRYYISTYDGTTSKAFYDLGGTGWRAGFITKRKNNQDCDNYHMRPMKLFARPISQKFTLFTKPDEWTYGSEVRVIQGTKCLVLPN